MTTIAASPKPCTACGQTKPLGEFYPNPSKPNGHERRCKSCYRAAQHGELPKAREHPRRFWAKVDARGDCWEWTAKAHTPAGYGMYMLNKRPRYAHRVAYELLIGPIPEGLHIDHLCRNRNCVNPDHLEPVTQAENNRRMGLLRRRR